MHKQALSKPQAEGSTALPDHPSAHTIADFNNNHTNAIQDGLAASEGSEAVLRDLENMSYAAELYDIPVVMLRDYINKNK